MVVVLWIKALFVVESRPSVSGLIKTTETIESLSQQDLLYKNLESRRGKPDMSMLAEVAEAAVALAELQTQPEDLPTAVHSEVVETVKVVGQIVKKMAWRQVRTVDRQGARNRSMTVRTQCSKVGLQADTMKCSFRDRWNSKAGSLTTKDAIFRDPRPMRSRMSSEIYKKMVPIEFQLGPNQDRARELADQDDCHHVVQE